MAAWAAVFLACAGTGAYIAAHTDLFPPGVDRQGGSPFPTVSPSPRRRPRTPVWAGTLRSVTYHELYVGGRCTTRWRGNLGSWSMMRGRSRYRIGAPGRQAGVRLPDRADTGPAVRTRGGGHVLRRMEIRLLQSSIDPTNGHDFGGFGAFLPVRRAAGDAHGAVRERIDRRRVDEQGRGLYSWSTVFDLTPSSGVIRYAGPTTT